MTDIPIIFSAPMVRAQLDGRKTMTRRLAWRPGKSPGFLVDPKDTFSKPSPWQKVKPGDRLWVRENVRLVSIGPGDNTGLTYVADGEVPNVHLLPHHPGKMKRASITPCIHMPRWASRLTLVVTDTKVERLQDISEADAIAEGTQEPTLRDLAPELAQAAWSERQVFQRLWTALHGAESWDANPEVVALSFEVHHQNIDQLKAAA